MVVWFYSFLSNWLIRELPYPSLFDKDFCNLLKVINSQNSYAWEFDEFIAKKSQHPNKSQKLFKVK